MIDLYAMGSPNVVKIYIALEEMGLPYNVHPVDVFGEAQFNPEFLRLNPNAKARPAVRHALAAVDEVRAKTTQFDKAGAEAMDRLLGRGRHTAAA